MYFFYLLVFIPILNLKTSILEVLRKIALLQKINIAMLILRVPKLNVACSKLHTTRITSRAQTN